MTDGADLPLAAVVRVSAEIAGTAKRNRKVASLAGFLSVAPQERVWSLVTVLSGALPTPPLGVGPARLRAAWPGEGAPAPGEPSLTLADLEATLHEVAAAEGKGSVARKIELLRDLLERATHEERSFVFRLCFGELRQGAQDGVMVEAVAGAFGVKSALVRRSHMLTGDLPETAVIAASEGDEGLARIGLRVMRPVEPMLAASSETPAEALARHGTCLLEWKLDGARIQAHKAGTEVRVFTRALRDVSGTIPEIVRRVAELGVDSVVLDGEALALRPDGRPHPFQVTMGRFGASRRGAEHEEALPLTPFFFDILHLEGETLVDRPLRERRKLLHEVVPAERVTPAVETDAPEEADAFLRATRDAGHEGIMAKDPEAPYEAGRRGKAWLKIKPATTLDLVVLAVERGSGRREGWWSNIHLGARDPESGGFVMLGKTFKGMTDETLRWQTETFPGLATRVDEYVMYLRPEIVAEVAFNEIQRSRRYPGGLALRFARLKGYRTDKSPEEADTIGTVRQLFTAQTGEEPPG